MILAKKANREIEIAPEKVKEYKELGYTIVQDGKVIHKPDMDSKESSEKLMKAQETMAEKDKTIADLNAKIAENEKTAKKSTGSSKASK